MKNKISTSTILLVIFFLGGISVFSKEDKKENKKAEKCKAEQLHQDQLLNNPAYKLNMENFNKMVHNMPLGLKSADSVLRVPVVIHIMHKGEAIGTATNLSDADINQGIKLMNQLFRKESGSKGDGTGVDVEIEFALAVRDPNGNCTDGIVRYDMTGDALYMSDGVNSGTSGISDASLKAYSVWDQLKYYNIWLISEIDNNGGGAGTQGYAFFASSHGQSNDGAVFLANNFATSTTATHELGHAMNLHHTFNGDGGGGSCPANTTCTTDGDLVCDTPPHRRSSSDCVVGTNACDGGSSTDLFIHNYMDYSSDDCQNMFTAGQRVRARTALRTQRASLLASNGNLSLAPPTKAVADFTASSTGGCINTTISFIDNSTCTPNSFQNIKWSGISFKWTFTNNLDTVFTDTVQNPTITFIKAGIYDVQLIVTNLQGIDSTIKKGVIIITSTPTAPICLPVTTVSGVGGFGIGIYNVTLNTINNTSAINDAIYVDYSCSNTTILEPNSNYSISVTGGTSYNQWWKILIDYNNDGDFVDAGEEVVTNANNNGVLNANFTTPAAGSITMNTNLRMRVISDYFSYGTPGSCANPLDNGQAEDYGVYFSNKVARVSINVAPSSTISYGATTTFTAVPVNGGASPTYQWYLNDVLIAGATASTYASTTLLNGAVLFVKMQSNLAGVIASPATSNSITMAVTGPPLSKFSTGETLICEGESISFTDNSLLIPTSWSWAFAGGSPATSTSQNQSTSFASAGDYTVSLTATNGLGTGTTETKINHVKVLAAPSSISTFTARTGGTCCGIGITKFKIGAVSKSTTYDDAYYQDFSCSDKFQLTKGTTYSIEVTVGASNDQWVRVYIDYDGDNSFAEANNLVFSPANGRNTLSGTFTVPSTATTSKLLRIRVISDFLNTVAGHSSDPLENGQIEDYSAYISSPVSLSLTSLNFKGIKNGGQIDLNWISLSKEKGGYFEVEHKINSEKFRSIGGVENEMGKANYSLIHRKPKQGSNYYRLKYTSSKGEVSYLKTVVINYKDNSDLVTYPVPFNDVLNIDMDGFGETYNYTLVNIFGQKILSGQSSTKPLVLNTQKLSQGNYVLIVYDSNQRMMNKICKK